MSLIYELANRPWRVRTILRARRVGLARKLAADADHIAHFETLAADVRRERRQRLLLAVYGADMPPWQHHMLAAMLDAQAAGRDVLVAMPPQHPQRGINYAVQAGAQ